MAIQLNGSVGINQNTTSATKIPVGTTAQRPTSPEGGMIRYNAEVGFIEWYDDVGDVWFPISFFPGVAATGGTVTDIELNGELFRVHTFTSDGTFDVARGGDADVLIVAGGGGGGGRHGGGGGAGGILQGARSLVTSTFAVVVGAGGTATQLSGTQGVGGNGANSSFDGVTAIGGGGGGSTTSPATGRDGGSGGGGGGTGDTDGRAPGTSTQSVSGGLTAFGNNGGQGPSGTAGGGGGGANAAGQAAISGDVGGAGGAGQDFSNLFGTSVGESGFFGGGGGGGSEPTRADPPGGVGGGGDGRGNDNGNAFNGTPNTGGGGGGHRSSLTSLGGGFGGSGIVIIRYRIG